MLVKNAPRRKIGGGKFIDSSSDNSNGNAMSFIGFIAKLINSRTSIDVTLRVGKVY